MRVANQSLASSVLSEETSAHLQIELLKNNFKKQLQRWHKFVVASKEKSNFAMCSSKVSYEQSQHYIHWILCLYIRHFKMSDAVRGKEKVWFFGCSSLVSFSLCHCLTLFLVSLFLLPSVFHSSPPHFARLSSLSLSLACPFTSPPSSHNFEVKMDIRETSLFIMFSVLL